MPSLDTTLIKMPGRERVNVARVYYFGDDGRLYGHTGPSHPFCLNETEDQCQSVYPNVHI